MGVSKNNGTPKSSILIGFSIIFTIHFGVPLFLDTSIYTWQFCEFVTFLGWWVHVTRDHRTQRLEVGDPPTLRIIGLGKLERPNPPVGHLNHCGLGTGRYPQNSRENSGSGTHSNLPRDLERFLLELFWPKTPQGFVRNVFEKFKNDSKGPSKKWPILENPQESVPFPRHPKNTSWGLVFFFGPQKTYRSNTKPQEVQYFLDV